MASNVLSLDMFALAGEDEQKEFLSIISDIFRQFPSASGYIIAAFEKGTGEAKRYWDGDTFWLFGDETRMEDPKVYRSVRWVNYGLKKAKEYPIRDMFIGVAFWYHPDIGPKVEKYMKMVRLWPGSPRH